MFHNSVRWRMRVRGVNARILTEDTLILSCLNEKEKKACWCLPAVQALNQHTEPHIYARTHLFVPQAGVLCGRHGNLGPPLCPSPSLISSSTLHDSLQSVNLELSPRDAISGTAAGGGGKQQEGGEG